jgi:chromosome partitioning protein
MCAASHVVIPTRSDEASLDGLTRVADTFSIAREHNPDLQLLGVVLFGITATGTALVREVTAKIRASLGDVAPVLDTRIRYLEAPAVGARDRGLLVHEYERDLVRSAPPLLGAA